MSRSRLPTGLLLAGLLFSAVPGGALAQADEPTLEGTEWHLDRVAGSGVPFIDVPPEVTATLRIDGAAAGGDGGCNSWFGDVKVDGAQIVFAGIGSTMMACEEPRMSFEGQYLGHLAQVQAWSIADGRLQLADAGGAVLLEFVTGTALAIEGVEWRAEKLLMGAELADLPADVGVTLLMTGGQATGGAGCNRYFGGYTLDGASLTFQPMAATEMACPEPKMEIESAWLTTLGLVTGQRVVDGHLQLVDGSDTVVAVLGQASASVVGTWVLAALGDPATGTVTGIASTDAVMTLGEDGSLTGNTGCNIMNGDYAIEDAAIKIGPVATTKRACREPGVAQQESLLLAALEAATAWRISVEGWLELTDADGALLAGFTPGVAPVG